MLFCAFSFAPLFCFCSINRLCFNKHLSYCKLLNFWLLGICIPSGTTGGSSWGISSIFGGGDNRVSVKENTNSKHHNDPVQSVLPSSTIHLREVYIYYFLLETIIRINNLFHESVFPRMCI